MAAPLLEPSVNATSAVVEWILLTDGVLGAAGLDDRFKKTVNDVGPPKPLVPLLPMLKVTF
jgi:hypothetical protein